MTGDKKGRKMVLKDSVRAIKGVGEKTEKLLNKLGIFTVEDLIGNYPRDYDLYEEPILLEDIKGDRKCAVRGFINRKVSVNKRGRLSVITTKIYQKDQSLSLTWFNQPYLVNILKRGGNYIFRGKAVKKRGAYLMEQAEIYTPSQYEEKCNCLQPIYGLTRGLTNKALMKMIKEALYSCSLKDMEFLPPYILRDYGLEDYEKSLRNMHFPKDLEDYKRGRKRFAFEELFLFIMAMTKMKEERQDKENPYPLKRVWETENVINNLPFSLTKAQLRTWLQIEEDLTSQRLMSRLVQGDVGSGKTILAFLAMIMAAQNGYQSAIMVPTEVLAKQHYQSLCKLLEDNGLEGFSPILLTGNIKGKQRKLIYEQIEEGSAKIIVGTQALFQEKVTYANLALVITDEQHRFGVNQRKELATKGGYPNILVMSATPIPRTLAIILYGDLDISLVDELPANRLPIKNCVVDTSYRPTAYRFIEKEIEKGHQVYVICPMIEENEDSDLENVVNYADKLREAFKEKAIVSILHGKMSAQEKNEIMEEFADKKSHILVSTTVIEVGINVPNATVMLIENAERFGLAQLHQLRGRVGRGDAQSYCIFMEGNQTEETQKRLDILNKSNDGFEIAAKDMELRGPGDLLGIRQSGMMNFQVADIYRDSHLLTEAKQAAEKILSKDYSLQAGEHLGISKRLEKMLEKDMLNQSI